jgi:hypothetical protein
MDLSFVNDIHLEDLELDPETQAALALVDLSDYHPTPDAATAFNPSPIPDHVTISLASAESSSTDSDSPVLRAPQPARFIRQRAWNVPDVTPQSPSTEQSSQETSPAGLAFTDPLIADEWRAHSAPTDASSRTQNTPVSEAPSSAPAAVGDRRLDTRVNTPTSTTTTDDYRSPLSEPDTRPDTTPARYIPLSELSRTFDQPNTGPIYTSNSRDPPTRPPMDAYNPGSGWNYPPQSVQYAVPPNTQPYAQTQQSAPPSGRTAPRLTRQYARIWDDLPTAQHPSAPPTGWYLSNPVPAVQISPYYPSQWQHSTPPCAYCGAARGEHPIDLCPHAIACVYCARDHPGQTCPTPHQSCTPLACIVPENHRNAEPGGRTYSHWQCPRSGAIKYRY